MLQSNDISESGVAAKVADAGLKSYLVLAATPQPPYWTMAAADPALSGSDGPEPFVVGSRSGSGSNKELPPVNSSATLPLQSGAAYLAPELMRHGGGGPTSKASDVSAVGGSTVWDLGFRQCGLWTMQNVVGGLNFRVICAPDSIISCLQVYAFGIMLNELFTGGVAFKGGREELS